MVAQENGVDTGLLRFREHLRARSPVCEELRHGHAKWPEVVQARRPGNTRRVFRIRSTSSCVAWSRAGAIRSTGVYFRRGPGRSGCDTPAEDTLSASGLTGVKEAIATQPINPQITARKRRFIWHPSPSLR